MQTFSKRVKSMLHVDFKRMFTQPLYYIAVGVSIVLPILILVMTTMLPETTVDPATGAETVTETFTNVWQAIGQPSGQTSETAGMSLTTMCNINMTYFLLSVFVCLFIAADFRSGYVKNLFTVRAKKTDYCFSKTLVGFTVGVSMIVGYFVGAMLGGAIAGLPFDPEVATGGQVFACLLSKLFLTLVFVSIATAVSVAAKQRAWLSVLLSLGVGMLLFMMLSVAAPLNAGIMHVFLCLAGGVLFAVGLGAVSNLLLNKTDLV